MHSALLSVLQLTPGCIRVAVPLQLRKLAVHPDIEIRDSTALQRSLGQDACCIAFIAAFHSRLTAVVYLCSYIYEILLFT